ncbi:Uncharacterised protein [Bordetella pertussis]|nr:Uncharacterised protein [Bordetella pertussis]CFW45591.1 Uncharacterised protein [Bordetella pertussis]
MVQAPHPTHRLGLTTMRWWWLSLLMARAEQISIQARQPTVSLRLCAHSCWR